jgi:poly(3-hydroxyalkanoate) depolymerase
MYMNKAVSMETENNMIEAEQYINIRGHSIRYQTILRNNDATPLLICNGLGQSMETLSPFLEAFNQRSVIIFDVPGVGLSSVPIRVLSVDQHSKIVMDLLDHIGFQEVNIMGISWGGILAQNLARRFPNRCLKLVLTVTSAGALTLIPGSLLAATELILPFRRMSAKYRAWVTPRLYGGTALENSSAVIAHTGRNIKPHIWGYYSQMAAVRFWTSLHWLHTLKQHTLVVSGSDDPLIPAINQRILAAKLPNARLHKVQCGHLLFITKARELAPVIEQFLLEPNNSATQ